MVHGVRRMVHGAHRPDGAWWRERSHRLHARVLLLVAAVVPLKAALQCEPVGRDGLGLHRHGILHAEDALAKVRESVGKCGMLAQE